MRFVTERENNLAAELNTRDITMDEFNVILRLKLRFARKQPADDADLDRLAQMARSFEALDRMLTTPAKIAA